MKINFHIDPELETEHIDLWLHKITPEIDRLIQQIGADNQTLWCHADAQIIPVSYQDIFCLEAADRGINVFTADQQLFYHDRLSRLKEELPNDFITASRSAIFNYRHIDHLELVDNGLIDVVLTNQRRIQISRRNIKTLKRRLGI